MAKGRKGNINPNSLKNLTKGKHGFKKGNEEWKKSIPARIENGSLRKLTLNHLHTGEIEIPFNKATLYKRVETESGIIQNIEVKADYTFVMINIPNMDALSLKIIERAMRGDPDFVKMIIEFDENYKNRQIDIQNKAEKTKENLVDHIQRLTVMPITSEDDDIPDYDSLERTAE